jgi:hypothetical protein
MKIKVLTTAITFIIGLITTGLWVGSHPPANIHQGLESVQRSEIQLDGLRERFTDTGIVMSFRSLYRYSDGRHVSYGCYEVGSPSKADKTLRAETRFARAEEQGPKLNDKGEPVGARVVVRRPNSLEPGSASIFWTEGARAFTIHAPSLELALEFEKWIAASKYRAEYCYDFSGR